MKRWKTLRDRYVRKLKKVNGRKSGEEGPPYVSTWPFSKVMGFLHDSVKHRRKDSLEIMVLTMADNVHC